MGVSFLKAPRLRGVHTPHRKYTEEGATRKLTAPPTVMIPVSQHIGAPAEIVVKAGDDVFVGSIISKATGFVSASTHSSVSGTVKGISEVMFPDGSRRPSIIIESDGKFTVDPEIKPPVVTNAEEFVKAVSNSGLIGLGGAGFPTHVKLSPPKDKPKPDYLVINGAECEPYITSDYRTMIEQGDEIYEGIMAVKKYLDIENVVIGIESNKPNAIIYLKKLFEDEKSVNVMSLKSSYPQGAEKVLIATTTGRAVPMGGLPSDAGCIVLNVTTVAFIAKYLRSGIPLVSKRLTVAGGAVGAPGNYLVPIGTMVEKVLEDCNVDIDSCERILLGGPMMGNAVYTTDFPVLKSTNALLALTSSELGHVTDTPCIHCGRCADRCPMQLSPVEIELGYRRNDAAECEKLSVMNCIECGCCTFTCPAKRPLTQNMRLSKNLVRGAKK